MSGEYSNEELYVADGPHSGNLRRGRCSQAGQIYLLTMVGIGRSSVFADFARRDAWSGQCMSHLSFPLLKPWLLS